MTLRDRIAMSIDPDAFSDTGIWKSPAHPDGSMGQEQAQQRAEEAAERVMRTLDLGPSPRRVLDALDRATNP